MLWHRCLEVLLPGGGRDLDLRYRNRPCDKTPLRRALAVERNEIGSRADHYSRPSLFSSIRSDVGWRADIRRGKDIDFLIKYLKFYYMKNDYKKKKKKD